MEPVKCSTCKIESGNGVALLSVCGPGLSYMCEKCIETEENRTGRHGIFFYASGLKFLTDEEIAKLPPVPNEV